MSGYNADAPLDPRVLATAETLWDYHRIDDPVSPADAIVGLGSYDLRVADRCAALYLDGFAPVLIFTGARGNWTQAWPKTEAATFADRAIAMGVPKEAIRLEARATNIAENVQNAAAMLERDARVIFVAKPQTQRRCYAALKKRWPEARAMVTCPQHGFRDQPTAAFPMRRLIEEMVGDVWRLRAYAEAGFVIRQEEPTEVATAYELLVAAGFVGHLPADAASTTD